MNARQWQAGGTRTDTNAHGRAGGGGRVTRRGTVGFFTATSGAVLLAACGAGEAVPTAGEGTGAPADSGALEYFLTGDPAAKDHVGLMEEFGKQYPGIKVTATAAPWQGSENTKLTTAIAAGQSPDVTMITALRLGSWVERKLVVELDPLMARAKVGRDQLYESVAGDISYKGKFYEAPKFKDPNFPLYWNRALVQEVGLNPDKGPQTVDEYDQWAEKITAREGDQYRRVGHMPWVAYGTANVIVTWGQAFGGELVDPKNGKVTANTPQVVRALEWVARWAQRYDADVVNKSLAGATGHQMASERLGMAPLTAGAVRQLGQSNPGLTLGYGVLPHSAPGKPNPTWIAGWDHSILTGSKSRDLAWRFMHWMAYTPEGTQAIYKHVGGIPGWKPAPVLKEIQTDPVFKAFYDVLTTARLARINIPVAARLYDFLAEHGDAAIAGKITAKQAMDTVTQLTQQEWEQFNKQYSVK